MNDKVQATVVPPTRDLEEVCRAIEVVRGEIRFQVDRLKQTKWRTEEEQETAKGLIIRYLKAEGILAQMYGYQMNRLEREKAHGTRAPITDGDVDDRGNSAPFTEHEQGD